MSKETQEFVGTKIYRSDNLINKKYHINSTNSMARGVE